MNYYIVEHLKSVDKSKNVAYVSQKYLSTEIAAVMERKVGAY